jgi:hypothetical protein
MLQVLHSLLQTGLADDLGLDGSAAGAATQPTKEPRKRALAAKEPCRCRNSALNSKPETVNPNRCRDRRLLTAKEP